MIGAILIAGLSSLGVAAFFTRVYLSLPLNHEYKQIMLGGSEAGVMLGVGLIVLCIYLFLDV